MGNEKIKTSEGIIKLVPVEYTLSQWTENFIDYLRSSMSYTASHTLSEFKDEAEYIFVSQNSLNRYKK